MTPDLEARLRAALSERADSSEISPDAWSNLQARTRAVRRRRRAALTTLPLAAATGAAALAVALQAIAPGGMDGSPGTAGKAPGTTGGATGTTGGAAPGASGRAPVGEAASLPVPGRADPLRVWFVREGGGGYALCSAARCVPAAPGAAGGLASGGSVVAYGPAPGQAALVTARTLSGEPVAGTFHRPPGAPMAVWTVTYAADAGVRRVEVCDALGRVLARVDTVQAEPRAR